MTSPGPEIDCSFALNSGSKIAYDVPSGKEIVAYDPSFTKKVEEFWPGPD
jgi:hypothetical protein